VVENREQLGSGIDHHGDAPCLSETTEPRDRFSATRRWHKAAPEHDSAGRGAVVRRGRKHSGSEQGRTGGALWATSRAVNGLMTSTRD